MEAGLVCLGCVPRSGDGALGGCLGSRRQCRLVHLDVSHAVTVRLQGGVIGLRRSLEQCECGLALPKSSVQIRVSRPDLIRDLVALDVHPRLCRVNVGLRLGHAVLARASIKDSPLKIEAQFPDQISSVRPGIWGL